MINQVLVSNKKGRWVLININNVNTVTEASNGTDLIIEFTNGSEMLITMDINQWLEDINTQNDLGYIIGGAD